jgi:hypothetical protein
MAYAVISGVELGFSRETPANSDLGCDPAALSIGNPMARSN